MARISRDARLETREARKRLSRATSKPYWTRIAPGIFLGYRKGKWVRRRLVGQRRYQEKTIGLADDVMDAPGDYDEAKKRGLYTYGQASRRVHEIEEETSSYTVEDCWKDYLEWYRLNGRSEGDREKQSFDKTKWGGEKYILLPSFRRLRVTELTAKRIRKWRDAIATDKNGEPTKKATANRALGYLRAALNYAYTERDDIPSDSAWRRVKNFKGATRSRVRYLETIAARRLVNSCPRGFRQLVHAALCTGARYGELRHLLVSDYVPDAGAIRIRRSKSGKERYVPLTDEGIDLFDNLTAGRHRGEFLFLRGEDGEPWGPAQQIRRMQDACAKASITPPISFHDLRHTYASVLAMKGTPLQVIAKALGHTTTRMVEQHYAHLAPSYVSEQVRKNLPRFSPKRGKVRRMTRAVR